MRNKRGYAFIERLYLFAALSIFFLLCCVQLHAWVFMSKAQIGSFSQQGSVAYDYKVTITSTETTKVGEWILIPGGVQSISVTLAPQTPSLGTTAKVQTTTDPTYVVQLDTTNTTAIDWDDGVVGTTVSEVCSPVTAIRLVQTSSGTTTLSIRAQ